MLTDSGSHDVAEVTMTFSEVSEGSNEGRLQREVTGKT